MTLSVCIITFNEEANIARTLQSVQAIADEIIIVDSGSTDSTVALAQAGGAKVFVEPWKGFALQKNSALEKATCDWILSLDADEEVSPELARSIAALLQSAGPPQFDGYMMNRRNIYFGTWLKRCGYYPDPKLRMVKRGSAQFELRPVHEDMKMAGRKGHLQGDLLHHAYRNLEDFLEHQNRYSSLGAEMVAAKGKVGFSFINIILRPLVRFVYNYFFRLGFLDGRVGLLVLMNHAMYVSWKYAKAWELSRNNDGLRRTG
ncbi:MAG TPA: glycosyltransferase family 2 protein [Candidatus Limnocylindrales bacterium]|nr:glycosyltransferase family 2 protein [Candidatus Limnocylindrales bacterium]